MRRPAMYPAPAHRRPTAAATLPLLLTLLLLGCEGTSGNHWTWEGDATADQRALVAGKDLDPVTLREMGYSLRWLYQLELAGRGGVTEAALLDDLLVAVEGPDNVVTAVRLSDGEQRWKVLLGQDLESLYRPLRRDDNVYVNSAARFFTLDARSGEWLGVTELETPVAAGGVRVGDFVVFGGASGMAFGHDLDAGYAKWRYKMTGRLVAPPIASGENVFLGDEVGSYVMLDAVSGEKVFRNRVFDGIVAPAAVHRGDVLVPSRDRSLYALNRTTGTESWVYRADAPLTHAPRSVGRDIYLIGETGGLVALNPDGTLKWQVPLRATPVLATDAGLYAVADDALLLLDPEDGGILQGVRVANLEAALTGPDGELILRTSAGRFVRLDPVQ